MKTLLGNQNRSLVAVGEKSVSTYKGLTVHADVGAHDWVVDQLGSDPLKVLDLGCGAGALAQRLTDLGHAVTGVDEYPEAPKVPGLKGYEQCDLDDPSAVQVLCDKVVDQFDVVLLVEVVEHLPNPELAFRLANSALFAKGRLLITTPNITSFLSRLVFLVHGRFFQFWPEDESYGHLRPLTWWELTRRLERCGFSVQQQQGVGSLPDVWLHGGFTGTLFHLAASMMRPLMRGPKAGWALGTVARPSDPPHG